MDEEEDPRKNVSEAAARNVRETRRRDLSSLGLEKLHTISLSSAGSLFMVEQWVAMNSFVM